MPVEIRHADAGEVRDESGVTAIEDDLIAAGITLAIISTMEWAWHEAQHEVHLYQ
jgi:hypothetical protein